MSPTPITGSTSFCTSEAEVAGLLFFHDLIVKATQFKGQGHRPTLISYSAVAIVFVIVYITDNIRS